MALTEGLRWRSAVVEGFAVLVGILLAFGIDAAWDARGQREETREHLAAIRTELESNREQIHSSIQSIEDVIDESFAFLETVAGNGATPTYEQTVAMVAAINPARQPSLAQSALGDVLSSGGLSQIESVPLRRALSEYQRSLVDDEVRQAALITNFRRIRDYTVDEGGMSATHWEQWVGVPESSANFALPVEAFAANRTYANLLVNRMQSFSSMRAARLTVLDRIEAVLALMEGAI